MIVLGPPEYSLSEKSALKTAANDPHLQAALAKFFAYQCDLFREKSYQSAENNLRQADKYRGAAEAYQDLLGELKITAKRL